MRNRITLIIIIFCLYFSLQAAAEYYLQIDMVSPKEIQKLTRIVSIDKIDKDYIYAFANQQEYDLLRTSTYTLQVIPGTLADFAPTMASSLRELRDWDHYPTYDTYLDAMYQFAADYPDICEVFSIGSSVQGRDLLVAHIGDDLNIEDDEPEFYYMGQIHGNELVTYIVLLHLIDDLLTNYGTDPRITAVIDNIDLYINPLCNPDGTYIDGNDTVSGATRGNANGVDLNRNFPDLEDGPHPDGNEYQPETLVQMDFAAQHNFVLCSNLHSGAEVVNYPWDTWSILHADDDWWQMVSRTYADAVHAVAPTSYMTGFDNGITNGYQWYTTAGNHQDYMNWFHRCRDMTLELSDLHAPPESQLLDIYSWNYNSLLLYMEECLYGIRGIVENSSSEPLEAMITIPDHDMHHSDVVSDPAAGNYHRPIYAGNYDLEISAWGYQAQTLPDISAVENDINVQNITLLPAASCQLSGIISDYDTGTPLFGAWIELENTPLDAVMTAGDGSYQIDDIPEGEYEITVYAGGYITSIETVNITAGTNTYNCLLQSTSAISFESGAFPPEYDFYSTGNVDWFIAEDEAHSGIYSTRSGGIDHREITVLHLQVQLVTAGSITFFLKVSTEEDWDFVNFYLDDILQDSWSGSIDWIEISYDLSAGEHHFAWEYDKDNSVSGGSDCVWIDDILITGLPEIETILGDVDNNELAEAYDASLIQRYVVEMNPGSAAPLPWQQWRMLRADVDANNQIESYDAALILQYYTGMIDSFPAE